MDLNNFLMTVKKKLKRSLNRFFTQFFTNPCEGALCLLNNLFHRNRLTVSQVSVFGLEIFDHLNKGIYPASKAGPASKKKFIIILFLIVHVNCKISVNLGNVLEIR